MVLSFVQQRKFVIFFSFALLLNACSEQTRIPREDITHEVVYEQMNFDKFGRPVFINKLNHPSFTRNDDYYIVFYNDSNQERGYIKFNKVYEKKAELRFYYEFTKEGFRKNFSYRHPGSFSDSYTGLTPFIIPTRIILMATGGLVIDTFRNIFQLPVVMISRLNAIVNPKKDTAVEMAFFEHDNSNRLLSYTLLETSGKFRPSVTVDFLYSGKSGIPEKMKVTDKKANKQKTISY